MIQKTKETKQLFRRGNHTAFVYNAIGVPGIVVDANEVDSRTYNTDPFTTLFITFGGEIFVLDSTWPNDAPSGTQSGQYAFSFGTVLKALHGPAKYKKSWGPRMGEIVEYNIDRFGPRRVARHGIGYTKSYPVNAQPEVLLNIGGTKGYYKGVDGWYQFDIPERSLMQDVEAFVYGIKDNEPIPIPDLIFEDPEPVTDSTIDNAIQTLTDKYDSLENRVHNLEIQPRSEDKIKVLLQQLIEML
jgi:hypothetical protein